MQNLGDKTVSTKLELEPSRRISKEIWMTILHLRGMIEVIVCNNERLNKLGLSWAKLSSAGVRIRLVSIVLG